MKYWTNCTMQRCFIVGSYPTMLYEETMMKACMVRNTTDCDESWDVMVMHCYGFNIAYLSPVEHCGRYCMGE